MENNIIKENYVEVIKEKKIANTTKPEVLPVMAIDRKLLLPVIIQNSAASIKEIKAEVNNLKNNSTLQGALKILKLVLKVVAKITKACAVFIINFAIFMGIASMLVMSIAIVTRNIVNSKYNTKREDDSTYSIFIVKDDVSGETKSE